MTEKTCKWVYDKDSDCWYTACGHRRHSRRLQTNNKMVYCLYCGKKIKEEKEVEDGED